MNIKQFNNLVNSTDQRIGEDETKQLENLVNIFPYCQTGHLLLSKASKEQGNITSEMKVRTASAYSVNRRHLKRFLLKKILPPFGLTEGLEKVETKETSAVDLDVNNLQLTKEDVTKRGSTGDADDELKDALPIEEHQEELKELTEKNVKNLKIETEKKKRD